MNQRFLTLLLGVRPFDRRRQSSALNVAQVLTLSLVLSVGEFQYLTFRLLILCLSRTVLSIPLLVSLIHPFLPPSVTPSPSVLPHLSLSSALHLSPRMLLLFLFFSHYLSPSFLRLFLRLLFFLISPSPLLSVTLLGCSFYSFSSLITSPASSISFSVFFCSPFSSPSSFVLVECSSLFALIVYPVIRLVLCHGRGHVIDHLLEYPSHTKLYSHKLQRQVLYIAL